MRYRLLSAQPSALNAPLTNSVHNGLAYCVHSASTSVHIRSQHSLHQRCHCSRSAPPGIYNVAPCRPGIFCSLCVHDCNKKVPKFCPLLAAPDFPRMCPRKQYRCPRTIGRHTTSLGSLDIRIGRRISSNPIRIIPDKEQNRSSCCTTTLATATTFEYIRGDSRVHIVVDVRANTNPPWRLRRTELSYYFYDRRWQCLQKAIAAEVLHFFFNSISLPRQCIPRRHRVPTTRHFDNLSPNFPYHERQCARRNTYE